MATILHREVIGPIHYLRVDADPALAGTAAPIGSIAVLDTGMAWYLKQGAGDGDWTWSDAGASAGDIATALAHITADGSSHADVATNTAAIAAVGAVSADRATGDEQFDGNTLAAAEGTGTALTASSADLGTARRRVKWRMVWHFDTVHADNNAWTLGLRADSVDLVMANVYPVANTMVEMSGQMTIRTTGAGGTFDSKGSWTYRGTTRPATVIAGAIDTTGSTNFTPVVRVRSNEATDEVTLREFEIQVLEA